MRKFYQKNWFDIDFKSFTELDSKRIANVAFYDKFYDEFYKRYKFYEELSEGWRKSKKLVAEMIKKQTVHTERILSIGCGSGYVEYLLRKDGKNITAIEPSTKATRFLKQFSDVKLYEGCFPNCLIKANDSVFDLAYMSGVEYCFNKQTLDIFLKEVYDFGIKKLLLISASWYDRFNVKRFVKDVIKMTLASINLYELGQFWGYQRTPQEFAQAFLNAGFKNLEDGYLQGGQYWITGVRNQGNYQ